MSMNREYQDQAAQMHKHIWIFAVHIRQKGLLSTLRIITNNT